MSGPVDARTVDAQTVDAQTFDARLVARGLARGGCGAGLALFAGVGAGGALLLGGALAGTALVERLALAWARPEPARRWRAAAAATAGSAALLLTALAHLVALHDAGRTGFDAGASAMTAALRLADEVGVVGLLVVAGAALAGAAITGASLLGDLSDGDPLEWASTWLVGGATLAGLLPTLVVLGAGPGPVSPANVGITLVVGFPIAFVGAGALLLVSLVALLIVDALGDVGVRLVAPAAAP